MWVWIQSSLKILSCPSLFLQDSHCILALNVDDFPACNGFHQIVWQMYITEFVKHYATWLSDTKVAPRTISIK